MRRPLAISGLLALAAAAPQLINIDAVLDIPTPTVLGPNVEETKPAAVSYNPTAAASAVAAIVESEGAVERRDVYDLNKRAPCDLQPPG
jgi:hypothetical protein